jgi:hypothetical protein
MKDFNNNLARLIWLNIKSAKKEDKLGLLMLYSAVEHPENMKNMLPINNMHEEASREL